MIEVVAAKI